MSANPAEREMRGGWVVGWGGRKEEKRPIHVYCETMWNACWYSTLDTPILLVFINGMLTDAGRMVPHTITFQTQPSLFMSDFIV